MLKIKKKYLLILLILILTFSVVALGFSLYKKSRPQTSYLTAPRISQRQAISQAQLICIAKVKQQTAKQIKYHNTMYTAYKVYVTQVLKGATNQNNLILYRAGYRNKRTGSYVLYKNDSIPLVGKSYIFILSKKGNHYYANAPITMEKNNTQTTKRIKTLISNN